MEVSEKHLPEKHWMKTYAALVSTISGGVTTVMSGLRITSVGACLWIIALGLAE